MMRVRTIVNQVVIGGAAGAAEDLRIGNREVERVGCAAVGRYAERAVARVETNVLRCVPAEQLRLAGCDRIRPGREQAERAPVSGVAVEAHLERDGGGRSGATQVDCDGGGRDGLFRLEAERAYRRCGENAAQEKSEREQQQGRPHHEGPETCGVRQARSSYVSTAPRVAIRRGPS